MTNEQRIDEYQAKLEAMTNQELFADAYHDLAELRQLRIEALIAQSQEQWDAMDDDDLFGADELETMRADEIDVKLTQFENDLIEAEEDEAEESHEDEAGFPMLKGDRLKQLVQEAAKRVKSEDGAA